MDSTVATETLIGSIKAEEVICVVKQSKETTGYLVFGLQESAETQGKSFQLVSEEVAELSQSVLGKFLVSEPPQYLQDGTNREVHLVVSTGSGTGRALDFYHSVLQPLLASLDISAKETSAGEPKISTGKHSYDLMITQDAESVQNFARSLDAPGQQSGLPPKDHTVILLSGDGGVVEMLNGKAPSEATDAPTSTPTIAVLPLGTGNALFNSIHKQIYKSHSPEPSALVVGLRTLLKGHPAPLPSFRASFSPGSRTITYGKHTDDESGRSSDQVEEHADSVSQLYGAIVASYGFHSQLVWESDTPEYRKHGDKRFGMVAAELLKESHAYNATLQFSPITGSATREVQRQEHAYILATLVSNLEKTFTISPASEPLDGKLRLVHFGAVSGDKTMEIMTQAYNEGNHVGMKWTAASGEEESVGYEEIQQLEVTTFEDDSRWRKVCIDGTIVELPKGGSMTVKTEEASHFKVLVDQSIIRR